MPRLELHGSLIRDVDLHPCPGAGRDRLNADAASTARDGNPLIMHAARSMPFLSVMAAVEAAQRSGSQRVHLVVM